MKDRNMKKDYFITLSFDTLSTYWALLLQTILFIPEFKI